MKKRAVGDQAGQCAFHPMVSIVIPVYNGANYMREAIDSALNQTYDNVEVIVVNDGSRDEGRTEEIALSYGDRIRYYSKPNGGVATALNLGIEKMRGEYFSWLSHDDMYTPEKVAYEVEQLSGYPDRTMVVAEGFQIIDAGGNYLYTTNISDRYTCEQLENGLFCLLHCGIHACATLIHKSHFERVGRFDPSLPTTQDFDLLFRILRGQKILFLETSHVLARSHGEQGSKVQLASHIKECDELWIGMMTKLSDQEKTEILGSPYLFYKGLWNFLATFLPYPEPTAFAHRRMVEEGMQENSGVLTMIANECGISVSEIQKCVLLCQNKDKKKHRIFFQIEYRDDNERLNKAVIQMANTLSETYDVYLGNRGGNQQVGYKTEEAVTEILLGMPITKMESYVELLVLLQVDVFVLNYCCDCGWLPLFAALKAAGIRSIAWSHEDYFLPLWRESLWKCLPERRKYLPMADAVIWLNQNSLSVYGAQFENGVCIPDQLPEGCVSVSHADGERRHRKGKKLIAVGRYDDSRKGLGDLLRAFAMVRDRHEEAELYIVGTYDLQLPLDQDSGLTCQAFIERMGLDESCLHFSGWVENIADYYAIGALHIMPSYYEGFGLVVLEAAANGVPTVAYDGSGMADIISSGTDGLLVERGNWRELAERIADCLERPEAISAMCENLPDLLKRHSKEAIAARWCELIDTVMAGNDEKEKALFSNVIFRAWNVPSQCG